MGDAGTTPSMGRNIQFTSSGSVMAMGDVGPVQPPAPISTLRDDNFDNVRNQFISQMRPLLQRFEASPGFRYFPQWSGPIEFSTKCFFGWVPGVGNRPPDRTVQTAILQSMDLYIAMLTANRRFLSDRILKKP